MQRENCVKGDASKLKKLVNKGDSIDYVVKLFTRIYKMIIYSWVTYISIKEAVRKVMKKMIIVYISLLLKIEEK